MHKYRNPRQFAYIDHYGKFRRLGVPIHSEEQMISCVQNVPHIAAYMSVYGWTGWHGGLINNNISKTAVIDGVFIDLDDKYDPIRAIRDAAEIVAYVGHSVINFSGWKGAHLFIRCHPVDLIPDLKGSVLRMFVNNLADTLPELDTMDFSVAGDTSRVKRIENTMHPKTRLYAIGLTAYELATLTLDEIRDLATNRRDLDQIVEPSQWLTDELYRLETKVLHDRMNQLIASNIISDSLASEFISDIYEGNRRPDVYRAIVLIGDELHKIRLKNYVDLRGEIIGSSAKETWLIHAVRKFKATGRASSGTRKKEHKDRCHLVFLADECGWTRSEIHDMFTGADDYDSVKTERQINSLIGRN